MALTNSQYETIMKLYEARQTNSRHLLEERTAYVMKHIPGYNEVRNEIASVSVRQGKQLLLGNKDAIEDLKTELARLRRKQDALLTDAGLPTDYLAPVYECPACKDTGYIDGRKCHCFLQAQIDLLYEQSGIRKMLENENFSTLSYEYYQGEDLTRFKNTVLTCRNFINNFNSDYHNLFFYGTVGTGKSFLSSCIAKELIEQGKLVIYFSSAQLFETLSRSTFDRNSEEAASGIYEDIYECDLLIIDDLGTELTNAFVSSQLFSCLNNRHLRRKSTIITTNLSLEELRDRYSDRIFSRITSNYGMCKLTGRDIRITKKLLLNRK